MLILAILLHYVSCFFNPQAAFFHPLDPTQDLSFLSGPDVDVDDIARTLVASLIVNGQNFTLDFTQIATILATVVILGEW